MARGYLAFELVNALLDFEEDEDDLNEIEEQRILIRTLRDTLNPFECPETAFRSYFRLSRELALGLCEWLRPTLTRERKHGLSVEKQVLAALRFFATGSNQGGVGQDMNIAFSQTSISRCINNVAYAISHTLLRNYVKFPTTPAERQAAKRKFEGAPQPFLGAIGAIDCSHVAIDAPVEHEEDYKNHHGFHSVNVQLVCDPSFKILQVCARFSGTRHDAFIWNASPLRDNMQAYYDAGERQTWLIGDSGYPLEPWLLTPIPHAAEGTPEARYTTYHCKARSVIERCIGILKGTWNCLSKKRVLRYNPVTAGRIINACVVLHNLRLEHNIEPTDDEIEDVDEDLNAAGAGQEPRERHRLAEATRIQDAYIARNFA